MKPGIPGYKLCCIFFQRQSKKSKLLKPFVGYYCRSFVDPVSFYHFIPDNFTFDLTLFQKHFQMQITFSQIFIRLTFERFGSKSHCETCFILWIINWSKPRPVANFYVDKCVEPGCISELCRLPPLDLVIRHYFTIKMKNLMLNRIFVNGFLINVPSIPFWLEKPRNHFSFKQVDTHHFQHWFQIFT